MIKKVVNIIVNIKHARSYLIGPFPKQQLYSPLAPQDPHARSPADIRVYY